MKTTVTIELTEDQRTAVGLLETGRMIPASRDEVRSYATEIVMASIGAATQAIARAHDDVRKFLSEGPKDSVPKE